MNVKIVIEIGLCLADRLIQTPRYINVELPQYIGLGEVVPGICLCLSITLDEIRQNIGLPIDIRQCHQIEIPFTGPTKRIFTARASHPQFWIRTLYRLWENRHIIVCKKFAAEINGFV